MASDDELPPSGGKANKGESIRRRIEQAIEAKEKERKRKLQEQRLSIAKEGMLLYRNKRHADAVKQFLVYLRVLEELKQVSPGKLHPGLFDTKAELPELVLITAVYWDLVKLYDRTRSPEKQGEFNHYLEQYVVFSKNMSYETVSAESIRKYIATNKPLHKQSLVNAYKRLAPKGMCYIATALQDVTDKSTLTILRAFRDDFLMNSANGARAVGLYYRVSPKIAKLTDRFPTSVRRALGWHLSRFAAVVEKFLL